MASSFRFGFAGDDIDIDDSEEQDEAHASGSITNETIFLPQAIPAKRHSLTELVCASALDRSA
jgi:protein-histidine N-methyltransferase